MKGHHLNTAILKFDLHTLSQFHVRYVRSKKFVKLAHWKLHNINFGNQIFLVICDYFNHISLRKHNSGVKFHRGYEKNMGFHIVSKSPI